MVGATPMSLSIKVNAAESFPRLKRLRMRSCTLIRAVSSDSGKEEDDDGNIKYVLKLGFGSVAGAAVIKYGSVVIPQVTSPNLTEALCIIIMPVIVAVLILLANSRTSP